MHSQLVLGKAGSLESDDIRRKNTSAYTKDSSIEDGGDTQTNSKGDMKSPTRSFEKAAG